MKKIQLVNYSGHFDSEKFQINKLSYPESFDDYDFNIIDLSSNDVWLNKNYNLDEINMVEDLKIISSMIQKTKNKVLVILPQNIQYKYYWETFRNGEGRYSKSIELKKNIPIINAIINLLIKNSAKNTWLMYNKTKSKVCEDNINCDFVFQNISEEMKVTMSTTETSITGIKYFDLYFTTLNLKTENDIINYLSEIKWFSKETSIEPTWINEIKIFDDLQLEEKKQGIFEQIQNLKLEDEVISKRIDKNRFYKRILYKTGEELVFVVNIMLKEMLGYEYEEFKDIKEEDFLFESEGYVFIGEIKGISSNIKRSNVLQTSMHKTLYLEELGNEDKNVIALAIINRQRDLQPSLRDAVSKDVIKIAVLNEVLLITTETFLSLYEKFIAGDFDKTKIIELLTNNKGLLEL